MKALILPTATAERSIVKSASIPLPVGLPPFFFRDEFDFEIEFIETPSWFDDSSVVVSLTIGTFEDGLLITATNGTKVENGYKFELDLNTTEFDQYISGEISQRVKLEIQVEGTSFSKTLVQKNITILNRIGSPISFNINAPLEPTINEAQITSPPNQPSDVNSLGTPKPVVVVSSGRFGVKPSEVKAGNLSARPSANPSLINAIIPPTKPAKPYWVDRVLRDAPLIPVNVVAVEKFFPPSNPISIEAQVLNRPANVGNLHAFEVVFYKGRNDSHRFIKVDTSQLNLPNGQLQTRKTILG